MKKEKSLELCTKCGTCLSICPSYRVFLSEPYSPRGRNFLLSQNKFHRSFDFCLFCERCKKICPNELSFPEFYLKKTELNPYFLSKSLEKFWGYGLQIKKSKILKEIPEEGDLLIYPSCGNFLFFSLALEKFLKFVKKEGFSVGIPRSLKCCGALFLSYGVKKDLRQRALFNLRVFERTSQPILMFCATCLWMFKRIYPFLFEDTEYYERFVNLAKRIKSAYFFLNSEFQGKMKEISEKKAIFHLPCHLTEEFNLVNNTKLEIKDFCCGSPKSFLWLEGFQERYRKFWYKNLDSFLVLATFCTGCYLTFKFLIKEPPKIYHWLEVLL